MHPLLRAGLCAALAVLLAGCGAPGSAVARHAIRGKLLDARGRPLAGQRVEVLRPAAYGFEGLDRSFGQPESHGHHAKTLTLTTDSDGGFYHLFDPTPYNITLLFIPPIGAIPRQPPEPLMGLRDGSRTYLLGSDHHHFDYRIIVPSGPPRRDPEQHLSGTYTLHEFPGESAGSQSKIKGWELALTIRR